MKPRAFFLTSALIAVLLASCAPQAIPPQAAAQPPDTQAAEVPAQVAQPAAIPTSRGDNLEATDPATVSLASGGIQLVEFFRFT